MSVGNKYSGRELEAMSFATRYHRWILSHFKPFLGKVVVEVGAGVGDFSEMLLQCDLDRLYSFEPAGNLFPNLAQRLENAVNTTPINEYFDPSLLNDRPDSVIYVNVLEHIENDAAELQKVHGTLGPGGKLLVFVPALSWLYSEADREMGHFRRYHKKPLAQLVQAAGFRVIRLRYFDLAGILPWYVYFRLLRGNLGASSVNVYDSVVVPVMSRVERWLIPPIGKNLILVAEPLGN